MPEDRVTPDDGTSPNEPPVLPETTELKSLAESQPERLYDLAGRFRRAWQRDEADAAVATRALGRIVEVLATTPYRTCARFATDILSELVPPGPAGAEMRHAATATLARSQQRKDLEPLFDHVPEAVEDPALEVRACILGELALNGAACGRPVLDAYAERLGALGHPLAQLPRTRLDLEHRFGVQVRGLVSVKTPEQLRARFPEIPPTYGGETAGSTAQEIPDADRARTAADPFIRAGWYQEPEVRFFALPGLLDPADFNITFLKALPLRCTEGEGTRRGRALTCHTTADDVLNSLFSVAYHGGVNGHPQGSAYARLYAWRSLYALMDLPAETAFPAAVLRAAEHRWLRFMAFTPWFHHDTADLGFAVLDPSHRRVAVLAATDTDPD